ncbi:MAG TPA: zinc ribbon domain-containing protein [Anaerohalosphaeraceae bacterium]|nr:zinc ribbon domain-containing protein [Anaerohalosphaeraceae bacterium]HQG06578.1 zinc ribbon domain-containing protein [Anaerohalosphaeraceae bacterium]HQI08028.1 zinc ribbon domain-containing protein [Anaerohalosphaeraceae bacterium]HQJ68329.1 zinc ribbon domain-containing protein [Anaerohalosphaeraceae bacterium]
MVILFGFGASRRENQGPTIDIQCPHCGLLSPAVSKEVIDWFALFFIPCFRLRRTKLCCLKCGKIFALPLPIDQLSQIPPDTLNQMLEQAVPSAGTSLLAVLALPASLIPIVGIAIAASALALAWKTCGWQKTFSAIALVMSIFFTIFFLIFHELDYL